MNPQKLRHLLCAPADDNDLGGGEGDHGTIAQAKEAITSTARETAARIKSAAGETAERAKTEAQRLAAKTKDQTASRVGGYANAMHESAKSLEQQDPNIAWATHQFADRIEGVANYVRNTDLNALRRDAEDWARRHPLAFFGGLFVGGLIVGNLLKARQDGANSSSESDPNTDWDSGNQSGSEVTTPTMSDTPMTDSPTNTGF